MAKVAALGNKRRGAFHPWLATGTAATRVGVPGEGPLILSGGAYGRSVVAVAATRRVGTDHVGP